MPGPDGRREPFPAAIVGNGSLLVTLSARGELERLFWPHVDWGQHLGELRLGVARDGRTSWLDEGPFTWEQRYVGDANVLATVARSDELEVEVVDVVLADAPVLVRRVRLRRGPADTPLRLVAYCRPELDESRRYGSVQVEPERGALVFWRRRRALALGLVPAGRAAAGAVRVHDRSVFGAAAAGDAVGATIEHGEVDGAIVGELGAETTVVVAFGGEPAEALERLDAALAAGPERAEADRVAHDAALLAAAREAGVPDRIRGLYRRSLLVLDLLTDAATGGVIAAPELDPRFVRSGGYGFVWGRDLAFVVLAFLAAGWDAHARSALRWLASVQSPEGLWLHRHWTCGALGPSWGLHQIDETGAALFAYDAAWRELGDLALDAELWPSAERAADFLVGFLDPETGLPRPSVDLWEEREGQHLYSAAAVAAGLRAAADMARRHGSSGADRYDEAAAGVVEAIERELWSEEERRYLRSRWVGRSDGGGKPLPVSFGNGLPYTNAAVASADPLDPTVDVSLLGAAWPYGVIDPSSPRAAATADAVERALALEGGLMRYERDAYAGGNAWVLATLWRGLQARAASDEARHAEALASALRARTAVGLLPEQVGADGSPAWVVPLAWSHAMLVLAAAPELGALTGARQRMAPAPG